MSSELGYETIQHELQTIKLTYKINKDFTSQLNIKYMDQIQAAIKSNFKR